MSGVSPTTYSFSAEDTELPAGDYLVVDPCYVIGEDPFWGEFIDFRYEGSINHGKDTYITIKGHTLFAFGTAYGDGSYPVYQSGHHYGSAPVDAGMLSMFPVALIRSLSLDIDEIQGVPVYLDRAAVPEVENGNLTCGNVEVFTGDDNEEEEE